MVDYIKNSYDIFIAHSSQDENQKNLYYKICEKYENSEINIIDVDSDENLNNILHKSILSKINECNLFICILTPECLINSESKETIELKESTALEIESIKIEEPSLNYNVLLELGYALSCIDHEYITLFIDNSCQKDFNKIKPSMISSMKYKTYLNEEDIIEYIDSQFNLFDSEITLNKYICNDKICVSNLKCELSKFLLDDNKTIDDKINIIDDYLDKYYCYEIFELIFIFVNNYINRNKISNCKIKNYFLKILYFYIDRSEILSNKVWINYRKNQEKLINLLELYKYRLFIKFKNIENLQINIIRRYFIIILFELLKLNIFSLKEEVNNIIKFTIENSLQKYQDFVYKLKGLYDNNFHSNHAEFYKDLIESSNNEYNIWYIS